VLVVPQTGGKGGEKGSNFQVEIGRGTFSRLFAISGRERERRKRKSREIAELRNARARFVTSRRPVKITTHISLAANDNPGSAAGLSRDFTVCLYGYRRLEMKEEGRGRELAH